MKITEEKKPDAGQKFSVDAFRPEDASGIANLFLSVYGPDYPVETYYYPEKIIAAVEKGDLHLVVCRTPTGDVVAGGALYRSSPVNQQLFEMGLYMVLPDYRHTDAAFRITRYIANTLLPAIGIDGIFGEAVTNHVATQKVTRLTGGKETAIELMLMPAFLYEKEQSAAGRVSCVMSFRIVRDQPQVLHLPKVYADILPSLVKRMELTRTWQSTENDVYRSSDTEVDSKVFGEAGVVRVNVAVIGKDFKTRLAALESEADAQGLVVRQWFLPLTDPAIGDAVTCLRAKGFFLGGYLPCWFGGDGLLMQKTLESPDYAAINLYYDETLALLECVRRDRESLA